MGIGKIMQTFLTSISFEQSARELDNLRLGKQRVEVLQILKALSDPGYGWQHHPAIKMWRGYEPALIRYGWHICQKWKSRGFKDTCEAKILSFGSTFGEKPPWLTGEFVSNHRAILLGKALETKNKAWDELLKASEEMVDVIPPMNHGNAMKAWKWYQQFNWSEKPAKRNEDGKWPFLWPVNDETSLKG